MAFRNLEGKDQIRRFLSFIISQEKGSVFGSTVTFLLDHLFFLKGN
jgi:hypothetical protein